MWSEMSSILYSRVPRIKCFFELSFMSGKKETILVTLSIYIVFLVYWKECIKSAYAPIRIRFLCLLFFELELRCRFLMQTDIRITWWNFAEKKMSFQADAQQQQIMTFTEIIFAEYDLRLSQFSSFCAWCSIKQNLILIVRTDMATDSYCIWHILLDKLKLFCRNSERKLKHFLRFERKT